MRAAVISNTFLLVLGLGLPGTASLAAQSFTRKPSAVRTGDKVKIEFAVSRETDVAVYVLDAKGKVVRHLAAGVLRKNAPGPLKPGLSQSVEWNMKDDFGKPAAGGPFKVRIALGLGAKYDRIVMDDPLSFGSIRSLAVGPGGTLYIRMSTGTNWPNGTGEVMVALNRDGSYRRTIMPFPANLPAARLGDAAPLILDGRPAPVVRRVNLRDFYGAVGPAASGMAVTRNGRILFPLPGMRLAAVDRDGGIPFKTFSGLPLFGKLLSTHPLQRIFVAISTDGKTAYMTGLGHRSKTHSSAPLDNLYPAVFKVPLPQRGPAAVLFGDMKNTGNDRTHLGGLPSGIVLDGKGNLLVGDPANERVVVLSGKTGRFVASLAVEGVDCVAADPKNGAIYVTRRLARGAVELVKFKGIESSVPAAKLEFRREGSPNRPWLMALDASARPPVIWMGGSRGSLLRIEDASGKFGKPRKVGTGRLAMGDFNDLSVDRRRGDVYFRLLKYNYWRFSEATGKVEPFRFKRHGSFSQQLVPGFDGFVYVHGYRGWIARYDHAGKPAPWPGSDSHIVPARTDMYINTGHQLGAAWDGSLALLVNADRKRPRYRRTLNRLTPGGKPGRWGPIWQVSEVAVGPKFDPQGNIYIAEQVRPKGWRSPPGMKQSAYLYGSIIKFSPKGGQVLFSRGGYKPVYPPGVKPDLDPALKTVDADYIYRFDYKKLLGAKLTGALWIHPGISHIEHAGCTCENIRFDVDGFGRVFYPDTCRFRVGVLDTNGNEITHFGGYGNADGKGPQSRDKSLAKPDIALAWLVGVGATDDYAYMGDVLNRRLLRVKLTYAAEEVCEVK